MSYFISADWSKVPGKRSVYVSNLRERRIERACPPGKRWTLRALMTLAEGLAPSAPVLVGVDVALCVPKGYWSLLGQRQRGNRRNLRRLARRPRSRGRFLRDGVRAGGMVHRPALVRCPKGPWRPQSLHAGSARGNASPDRYSHARKTALCGIRHPGHGGFRNAGILEGTRNLPDGPQAFRGLTIRGRPARPIHEPPNCTFGDVPAPGVRGSTEPASAGESDCLAEGQVRRTRRRMQSPVAGGMGFCQRCRSPRSRCRERQRGRFRRPLHGGRRSPLPARGQTACGPGMDRPRGGGFDAPGRPGSSRRQYPRAGFARAAPGASGRGRSERCRAARVKVRAWISGNLSLPDPGLSKRVLRYAQRMGRARRLSAEASGRASRGDGTRQAETAVPDDLSGLVPINPSRERAIARKLAGNHGGTEGTASCHRTGRSGSLSGVLPSRAPWRSPCRKTGPGRLPGCRSVFWREGDAATVERAHAGFAGLARRSRVPMAGAVPSRGAPALLTAAAVPIPFIAQVRAMGARRTVQVE